MRDFFRGKFFLTLVLIAAFLAGFMLNMLLDGGVMPHRDIVGYIALPFQTFGAWIKNGTTDFIDTFSKFDEISAENEELRKQVADLESQLNDTYSYQVEIDRLRSILNVSEYIADYTLVPADILTVSTDGLGLVYTINRGTAAGINKKDVVISADGLVGRVIEVGRYWAKISTILDTQTAVGAKVARTGDFGVTEGTTELKAQWKCRLSNLDAKNTILRGDDVITSGLGGVYPEGIKIGVISDIKIESNGLTQYAIIDTAVDFENLTRVYVLIDFETDDSME